MIEPRTFISGRPSVTVYRQRDGLRYAVIETRHICLQSPGKVDHAFACIHVDDIDAVIGALVKIQEVG